MENPVVFRTAYLRPFVNSSSASRCTDSVCVSGAPDEGLSGAPTGRGHKKA